MASSVLFGSVLVLILQVAIVNEQQPYKVCVTWELTLVQCYLCYLLYTEQPPNVAAHWMPYQN